MRTELGEETPYTHSLSTYIACIGERPGLLSLPLLFACSIAPLRSSRIALAKLPRVGFPMEAVVYRDILFSAIEAYKRGGEGNKTGALKQAHICTYTTHHIQVTLLSFSFSLNAKDKNHNLCIINFTTGIAKSSFIHLQFLSKSNFISITKTNHILYRKQFKWNFKREKNPIIQ